MDVGNVHKTMDHELSSWKHPAPLLGDYKGMNIPDAPYLYTGSAVTGQRSAGVYGVPQPKSGSNEEHFNSLFLRCLVVARV